MLFIFCFSKCYRTQNILKRHPFFHCAQPHGCYGALVVGFLQRLRIAPNAIRHMHNCIKSPCSVNLNSCYTGKDVSFHEKLRYRIRSYVRYCFCFFFLHLHFVVDKKKKNIKGGLKTAFFIYHTHYTTLKNCITVTMLCIRMQSSGPLSCAKSHSRRRARHNTPCYKSRSAESTWGSIFSTITCTPCASGCIPSGWFNAGSRATPSRKKGYSGTSYCCASSGYTASNCAA